EKEEPLTFTDKYMNFKSDVSKVKENVKYKVTKMRKAFLGGYVKSMILGAGITSVAAVATMTVTSFCLPPVIIGAGIGAGFNLLRHKMMKNMNIKLEDNAKEMSTDVETVNGLFDGFSKMKKAYKETQIKLKNSYDAQKNNELENDAEVIEEVTPVVSAEQVENLEANVINDDVLNNTINNENVDNLHSADNVDFNSLSSEEVDVMAQQYTEKGIELPQALKDRIISITLNEYSNPVDNLDAEVDARMGGR
ncbi:MAG: hypothetical protein RR478_04860, partial [Bacilli bacterium]